MSRYTYRALAIAATTLYYNVIRLDGEAALSGRYISHNFSSMRLAAGSTRHDEKTHMNRERKRKLAPRGKFETLRAFCRRIINSEIENANKSYRGSEECQPRREKPVASHRVPPRGPELT